MFAHASPTTSPTVTATGSTTTPVAAPPRQSRLRGLSYLRNYTQTHLSSLHHHSNNSASSPSESPTNSGNRGSPSPIHLSSSHSRDLNSSYFPPIEETSNTARSTGSQAAGSEASGEDRHTRMARKKPGIAASLSSQTEQTTRRGQSGPTASSSSQTTRSYLRLFTGPTNNPPTVPEPASDPAPSSAGRVGLPADQMPTIRFIPHQDPRSNKPSLIFTATSRTLPHEDCVIRVGRYSERDIPQTNPPPNVPSSAPVGFKSKVVSRRHCEFWCSQGQWYIKDVRSSSGTFLNHIRLSQPSSESKPFPVNDGDIIQLGIDFRGGEEPIFRCVKIRIECNRAWQKGLNTFKFVALHLLKSLELTYLQHINPQTTCGTRKKGWERCKFNALHGMLDMSDVRCRMFLSITPSKGLSIDISFSHANRYSSLLALMCGTSNVYDHYSTTTELTLSSCVRTVVQLVTSKQKRMMSIGMWWRTKKDQTPTMIYRHQTVRP